MLGVQEIQDRLTRRKAVSLYPNLKKVLTYLASLTDTLHPAEKRSHQLGFRVYGSRRRSMLIPRCLWLKQAALRLLDVVVVAARIWGYTLGPASYRQEIAHFQAAKPSTHGDPGMLPSSLAEAYSPKKLKTSHSMTSHSMTAGPGP